MKLKSKKLIYTIGSVILAVVVFLLSLVFTEGAAATVDTSTWNPGYENSSTEEESSTKEDDNEGGGLGGGGGESGGGGGGEAGEDGGLSCLFKITTDISGFIYLRQDSKADYTGEGEHGFLGDKKYYMEDATDENPLYYFGLSMEESNFVSHTAEIELVKLTNEILPYAPLSKTGEVNENKYTVEYFPYDYVTMKTQNIQPFKNESTDYRQQEERYREFVDKNYLKIDEDLKQTLLELAEENGISATSPTVIEDVAQYIQNAAYYDLNFEYGKYEGEDMVTFFLTKYKRGVCRHFAAAATMMYRALGIPARYTIGFAVAVTANETLEYVGEGHAWTEVYLDGYGWVAVEVTGGNMYVEETVS